MMIYMKVFLNPGHAPKGYPDPGACNEELSLRECDIVFYIGGLAKRYLEIVGCEVDLLQSDNLIDEGEGPSVTARANASGADVFVSIHCNAFNQSVRGTETLYYSIDSAGARLACCIQKQLVTTLQQIDGAVPDRGIKARPHLAVLRVTAMTAVLVETAFIDQKDDAQLLIRYPDDIARAIARGVTDFGEENPRDIKA
jgi:N-acetylmuramoyl-L-alanine amidase